jgi:hypothetical protein
MPFKGAHMSVGRLEFRRDRRYPVPPLVVRILERDYAAINWSLGGFLIDARDLGLTVGDGVEGTLHMPQTGKTCVFMAEVVWIGSDDGSAGAKFTQLAAEAIEALDNCMAQWLKRSRR